MEDIAVWIEEKEHLSAQKAWELLQVFSRSRLTFKEFRSAFAKIQKILSSGASDPGYSLLWRYCMLKGVARSNKIFDFTDPRYRIQLLRLIHAAEEALDVESLKFNLKNSEFMKWHRFIEAELIGSISRVAGSNPLVSTIVNTCFSKDHYARLSERHIHEVAQDFISSHVVAASVESLIDIRISGNENMTPLQISRLICLALYREDDPRYIQTQESIREQIKECVVEIERMLFPDQENYEWGSDVHVFGMDQDITWIALGRRFKTLEVHYRGVGTIMYEWIPDELFRSIIADPSTVKELAAYRWKRVGGCMQDQGCCEKLSGVSIATHKDPLPYHETWQGAPCTFV